MHEFSRLMRNVYFHQFDDFMHKWCQQNGLTYIRHIEEILIMGVEGDPKVVLSTAYEAIKTELEVERPGARSIARLEKGEKAKFVQGRIGSYEGSPYYLKDSNKFFNYFEVPVAFVEDLRCEAGFAVKENGKMV